MRANIHASCVSRNRHGILLLGKSGSGKSDLCLRLITWFGAKLVADDRVNLEEGTGSLTAAAPKILKGLLEVRGVGIVKFPAVASAKVHLAVRLVDSLDEVERLPQPDFYEFGGVKVPQISLYAFEVSAPAKIIAALTLL